MASLGAVAGKGLATCRSRASSLPSGASVRNLSLAMRRPSRAPNSAYASLVVGTAYPIYSTLALLESTAPAKEREQEAAQWLAYWAVYGVISAVEQLFETRPPWYYHIKLAFLFWLQHSEYQGARRLYVLFLRPFVQQHRQQIETYIGFVRGVMASPGAVYFGSQIHNLIAKVPYLQWFVQPFRDASSKPRHLL